MARNDQLGGPADREGREGMGVGDEIRDSATETDSELEDLEDDEDEDEDEGEEPL